MISVRTGRALWALAALAVFLVACLAGPQPEPPDDTHDGGPTWAPDAAPNGGGPSDAGGAADAAPGPEPGTDAGTQDPGRSGEGVPWLDDDTAADAFGNVAPFPFQPCCGWFHYPEADAGPDP